MSSLTYNDVLSAYSEYPAPIRPFLLRAETHPAIRDTLTKRGLRVFIDLLARAPVTDPTRPIMVRVDDTAARLDIGYRTVTRVIASMLDAGWLSRSLVHDGRNNEGKYSYREYVIGDVLRALVGLPVAAPSPADRSSPAATELATGSVRSSPDERAAVANGPAPSPAPETVMAAGMGATELAIDSSPGIMADQRDAPSPNSLRSEMADGHIRGNEVFLKEASAKDASLKEPGNPEFRIPANLIELHTVLGISGKGIGKLMNLAKKAKQRLQDVWTVSKDRILNAGAREGRAVRYLESLLKTGEDFSYRARIQHSQPRVKASAPHVPALPNTDPVEGPDPCCEGVTGQVVMHGASQFANRRFAGPHGAFLKVHGDGTGLFTDGKRRDVFVTPRDMQPMFEAIIKGILVEVRE